MTKLIKDSAILLMLLPVVGCAPTNVVPTAQIYDPVASVQEYTQRADKITLSAGDAQEVNTRIHEIDPWPRYVSNKRVAVNGERMAGAVERYRDVSKQRQTPTTLPLVSTSSMSSGGGGPTGAPAAVGAGAAGQ